MPSAGDRRGFAIGLVLFVITVFMILGAVILKNTYNEIPAVGRIDRQMEARYMARSLAEAIRLKLKNHPEEFADALREREMAPPAADPASLKLYATFLSDFASAETVTSAFGLGDERLKGRLLGMKRLYVGDDETVAGVEYVTDVIDLDVEVKYLLGREDNVQTSSEITLRLTERVQLKRRFKKG